MAKLRLLQEKDVERYYLPTLRYWVSLKEDAVIDSKSEIGQELVEHHADRVEVVAEDIAILDKLDGLQSSASEIDGSVSVKNKKIVTVSIDDFYSSLEDITINSSTYTTIFDNLIFNRMKEVHDLHGTCFSCYCYTNNGYDLTTTTDKFKQEFIDNSDWLKFGFHGKDASTLYTNATAAEIEADYTDFITALNIFADEQCLTQVVRLSSYQGSEEAINELVNNHGLKGLIGAEDGRSQYFLTDGEVDLLDTYFLLEKNIPIYRTLLRFEDETSETAIQKIKDNADIDRIELFTHEQVYNSTVQTKILDCCEYLNLFGFKYSFLDEYSNKQKRISKQTSSGISVNDGGYSLGTNYSIRSTAMLTIKKLQNIVYLETQLEKSTDIISGETVMIIDGGFRPAQNLIIDCWVFGSTTIKKVPLVIYTNGWVQVGFRNINPDISGDRIISINISYYCE